MFAVLFFLPVVAADKELKSVKIYRINNPGEGLLGNDKDTDLSVMFMRGKTKFQYLILSTTSVKQELDYISAKFLVNLDGALKFVSGKLYDNGQLVYQDAGKEVRLDVASVNEKGEGEYNRALYSFRIADENDHKNFLIESWAKDLIATEGEWVKIEKGNPVIVRTTYKQAIAGRADIFSYEINNAAPKARELKPAESPYTVTGDYGSVIISGAAGKKVVVSNPFGNIIANRTAASNTITIPAPTGIVMVSIDGQPGIKAIVK